MPELHHGLEQFSAADIDVVLADELSNGSNRYTPVSTPKAILLAGQPGAGKTELASALSEPFDNNVFFINADEYRRRHPNYRALYAQFGSEAVKITAPFSAAVTERLIAELSNHHFNLIIEGTGRTVDVPRSTAIALTAKGYGVELAVLAVRPEVSLCSTLLRFYQMHEEGTIPRSTALEDHDRVVRALPGNIDVLSNEPAISKLTIWDRELRCLFDSTISSNIPSEILTQFWHSPWSRDELCSAQNIVSQLQMAEDAKHLGQQAAIDEISQRLSNVQMEQQQSECMDFEMTL